MAALAVMVLFWNDRPEMLACSTVTIASIIVLSIAAVKLRQLERGLNGSDREKRDKIHSALEAWTISNMSANGRDTFRLGLWRPYI